MRLAVLILPALLILLPACGTSHPPVTTPPPDPSEALLELAEVYKFRAANRMPAPARVEDLNEHQAVLGHGWPLIQDKTVVVVWKVGYSAGSTEILAHHKDAATAGGKVLLRNGTIKQMTAEEFKAAKK